LREPRNRLAGTGEHEVPVALVHQDVLRRRPFRKACVNLRGSLHHVGDETLAGVTSMTNLVCNVKETPPGQRGRPEMQKNGAPPPLVTLK
jgi:hypothetical protein